jgi:bacterioferritin
VSKDKSSLVIKSTSFVSDVKELRRRARAHIEQGALTEGYQADVDTVVRILRILNEALATEIVCVQRYKRQYYMAAGIHAGAVADEFLEHATAAPRHVDQIAEGITQLGGEPDLNPESLGTDDPTTRRMLEEIGAEEAEEEDHASDLHTLLESLGKDELEKAESKR